MSILKKAKKAQEIVILLMGALTTQSVFWRTVSPRHSLKIRIGEDISKASVGVISAHAKNIFVSSTP